MIRFFRRLWMMARFCRGNHAWEYAGGTLGGIWIKCVTCETTEEFLPGLHEPAGGEAVWQAKLKHDRERFGWTS